MASETQSSESHTGLTCQVRTIHTDTVCIYNTAQYKCIFDYILHILLLSNKFDKVNKYCRSIYKHYMDDP